MPKAILPYLEHRLSSYYFRRRIPSALLSTTRRPVGSAPPRSKQFLCLSLQTQFLREAKALAHRLTATSDALFAARTETGMPISAEIMTRILRTLRDHEIQAHETARMIAPVRSPEDVSLALTREEAIQKAIREELSLGKDDLALSLVQGIAEGLGIALDAADADMRNLTHKTNRLLIEISQERARRETGNYGTASVLSELPLIAAPPSEPGFSSRATHPCAANPLHSAFGSHPRQTASEPRTPAITSSLETQAKASQPEQCPTVADLPSDPVARSRELDRLLPYKRIDTSILTNTAKEGLLDPWSLRIDDAFALYFECKAAGYADEFTKTQKRFPQKGLNWLKNSKTSLDVARRFWVEMLDNCKLSEVTDPMLNDALTKLSRVPKQHGKAFDNSKGFAVAIEAADEEEIQNSAAAEQLIASGPDLSEAAIEDLRLQAFIPRLRAETFLKHGRTLGRIGRFLEGLGALPRNPFALCSWTSTEEEELKAREENRSRVECEAAAA